MNPAILRALSLALALGVCACGEVQFHTAAGGTRAEAREVVALVYAQAPDSAIAKLPYSGGDLTRAIERVRDRFIKLKPWLDNGAIGNTAGGFLALRDASRRDELRRLLRQENWDRAFLHDEASEAVGHKDDGGWLAYESYEFGKQWIAQGDPKWWWLDERRVWHHGIGN